MRELSDESVEHQAEQFIAWQKRSRGAFASWAASKFFSPEDRAAIQRAIERKSAEIA